MKEKELQKEIKKLESRLGKMQSIKYKASNRKRAEELRDWLIKTKCFKSEKTDNNIAYVRVSHVRLGRDKNSYKLMYNEDEVYFSGTFRNHLSCVAQSNERCLQYPDSELYDFKHIVEGAKKIEESEFQKAWDSIVIPILDATMN